MYQYFLFLSLAIILLCLKTKNMNENLLVANLPKRNFKTLEPFIELPNLVENQISSLKKTYRRGVGNYIKRTKSYKGLYREKFELEFLSF